MGELCEPTVQEVDVGVGNVLGGFHNRLSVNERRFSPVRFVHATPAITAAVTVVSATAPVKVQARGLGPLVGMICGLRFDDHIPGNPPRSGSKSNHPPLLF